MQDAGGNGSSVDSEAALQRQLAKKLGLKGAARKAKPEKDDLGKLLADSGARPAPLQEHLQTHKIVTACADEKTCIAACYSVLARDDDANESAVTMRLRT